MLRGISGACLTVWACSALYAQPGEASPTFDVASVKPSPPPVPGKGMMVRIGGGPGTKDPGRINWVNVSLTNLLILTYDITSFQISGPDWLTNTRFDVAATIPKDATKEQFHVMLQNLMAERFKLKLHHEQRESFVYSLVVGKNGPKMKASPAEPATNGTAPISPPPSGNKMVKDEDGFPLIPGIRGTYMTMNNGRMRMRATQETMAQFINMLTGQLGHPVTDMTGLTGKYDFVVTYTPAGMAPRSAGASPDGAVAIAEPDAEPDIIGAMQQIGLKLEQKKGMIDVLVIDHIEKVPTEN